MYTNLHSENLNGIYLLRDWRGELILKRILKKWGAKLRTGFNWLSTGFNDGWVLKNIWVSQKDQHLLAG
jgi:hypothetical protein